MNVEIIAVGTELLLGQIVNTNAQFLARELASLGMGVYYHTVVGDNLNRLVNTFLQAWQRSEVVILTGGLGPTTDDLTREGVASALGRPLCFQEDVWQQIVAHMQRTKRPIPENNRRQAMVPEGAVVLPNPRGTAPGLAIRDAGRLAVLLPGPPREMQPMFVDHVRPLLLQMIGHGVILSRSLRVIGIGESALEEQLADLIATQSNPTIALYASLGELQIRITAKAEDEAAANLLIAPVETAIRQRIKTAIYGIDNETLPGVLGQLLKERGYQLAVAESCTGGLLGSMITDVSGSSDYFASGFITYSNEAKQKILGVSEAIIKEQGAVSAACAKAMATGARQKSGADVAIAITGIAGPTGGSPEKPVGTVYVAISAPEGDLVEELALRGERSAIRARSAKTAVNLARLLLLGELK
jgi:nicotinamide-nucleotide amidase